MDHCGFHLSLIIIAGFDLSFCLSLIHLFYVPFQISRFPLPWFCLKKDLDLKSYLFISSGDAAWPAEPLTLWPAFYVYFRNISDLIPLLDVNQMDCIVPHFVIMHMSFPACVFEWKQGKIWAGAGHLALSTMQSNYGSSIAELFSCTLPILWAAGILVSFFSSSDDISNHNGLKLIMDWKQDCAPSLELLYIRPTQPPGTLAREYFPSVKILLGKYPFISQNAVLFSVFRKIAMEKSASLPL